MPGAYLAWIMVAAAASGCVQAEGLTYRRSGTTEDGGVEYRIESLVGALSAQRSVAHSISDNGHIVGTVGDRAARWTLDGGGFVTGPETLELPFGGDPGPSEAMGVNNVGQVVGWLQGDTLLPFVWTRDDGLERLPLPDGIYGAVAYDINDEGEIIGSGSVDPDFAMPAETRVLLWSTDVESDAVDVVNLGAFDGVGARGHAINDAGEVAGVIWYEGGASFSSFFLGENLGLRKLPLDHEALALSDPGVIAGGVSEQAAVWLQGQLLAIGPLGSLARDVNTVGWVVGEISPDAEGARGFGFAWVEGELIVLEGLSTIDHGRARSINDQGFIVGESFIPDANVSDAALWRPR